MYDVGSIRSGSASTRYRNQQIAQPPALPKKSWKKQIMDSLRAFVAFVFSKVGICVLVIGYLLVGAVMFQNLEGPDEEKKRYEMEKFRSESVKLLWKTTEEFNTLHPKNWTLKVSRIIQEYQERIILEARKGYEGGSDIPDPKWTFTGSLLYSITVITTIGKVYTSTTKSATKNV